LGPPRSKKLIKVYIVIFVCIVTKAVHFEVATSFSMEAFHAALRSFIASRGKTMIFYAGNGTNLQGVAVELHAIYKMFNPNHGRQSYRTSAPLKDANGNSSFHMDFN